MKLQTLLNQLTEYRLSSGKPKLTINFEAGQYRNPFVALPNIESFRISTNILDPLLNKYGIAHGFNPEIDTERLNHRLRAANRYMRIQYSVLVNFLKQGRVIDFGQRWVLLLERSQVLRIVALRKLDKNWHRKFRAHEVKELLAGLEEKIQNLDPKMNIRRIYADKVKPDGTKTYRPIGSPSYVDRMYQYLWQCILVIYLTAYIGEYQHAYRPGKGVLTAWKDLKEALKDPKWEFVYEFDLKGFFPSLNTSFFTHELHRIGVPKLVTDMFFEQALAIPELPKGDKRKLKEEDVRFKMELDEVGLLHNNPGEFMKPLSEEFIMRDSVTGEEIYTGHVLAPMFEFIKANTIPGEVDGKELLASLIYEDLGPDWGYNSIQDVYNDGMAALFNYYQVQAALFESFKPAVKESHPMLEREVPDLDPKAILDIVTEKIMFGEQLLEQETKFIELGGEWDKAKQDVIQGIEYLKLLHDKFTELYKNEEREKANRYYAEYKELLDGLMPIKESNVKAGFKSLDEFCQGMKSKVRFTEKEPGFQRVLLPMVRGFPQGGGTSPVLSSFAFEHVLYREHFAKILKDIQFKIIAYADDFILFLDRFIDETVLMKSSELLETSGIEFSKEKSKGVKQGGQGLGQVKFLGKVWDPFTGELRGTPRSGEEVLYDKAEAIQAFANRDIALRKLIEAVKWDETPQSVLDKAGLGIEPFCLLPDKILTHGEELNPGEYNAIMAWEPIAPKEEVVGQPASVIEELEKGRIAALSGMTLDEFLEKEGLSGKPLLSEKDKQSKSTESKAANITRYYSEKFQEFGGLDSRIAGFIQSCLFTGGFDGIRVMAEDKSLKSAPRARGRAGIDLQTPESRARMTLFNSTSYSTLYLLTHLNSGKLSLKIKKGRIC